MSTSRTTSNDSRIVHNTLDTEEHNGLSGWVTGTAHTEIIHDRYWAQASVTSYEYEDGKLNHVPNVVLVEDGGYIVAEPHAHDSTNPHQAIENALDTAEWAINHTDELQDQ